MSGGIGPSRPAQRTLISLGNYSFPVSSKLLKSHKLVVFLASVFVCLLSWNIGLSLSNHHRKMQALSCNSSPLQSQALRLGTPKSRFIGRRQLFFDGMSSACSESQSNRAHSPDGAVSPFPISTQRLFSAFVLLHSVTLS